MGSLIVLKAQYMAVTTIAEIIDEYDTRKLIVLQYYVAEAKSKGDFSMVKSIRVDEKSRAKGHKYVPVFIDLDESRVIHVCEGKNASTIESFKDDIEQHNGSSENIDDFCCDTSPAFLSGIENGFTNASITFDKFHIMKLMNEAVDKVRPEEQSHNALLKKTRYIWLKNSEYLTIKQNRIIETLKNIRLKIIKVYNIKSALRDSWCYEYRKSVENYLKCLHYWATHSRLDPVIECAKMIKNHWNGVTNYIKTKIDNVILEGTNSLIQTAKDSARGFRSTKNSITLFILGQRNSNSVYPHETAKS